jgi:ACS family D-galactonate transporter-like MFS transporter
MATQPSSRAGSLRWQMVFMAFLATAINYVDRANLGVAAPSIQAEFHLSPSTMGLILGAFFWTYAIMQLPSGWFVDKVGARVAYALAVGWWSVFTAACALGRGARSLFGFRLLLGIGEAPAYPTNTKVVSEWFPRRERAFATSIFDGGARIGTALSLPIVSYLITRYGWRFSFVVTGLAGVVWSVAWLLVYRPPRQHPRITPGELAYIESDQETAPAGQPVPAAASVSWIELFGYRTIWGMMIGFFCLNFVIYFFITWFPTYLVKARGFSMLKVGSYGMIPPLVSVLGGYLGGFISDRLVRSGMSLTKARKIPIVIGMAVASTIALAVKVPTAASALALLSISYSGLTFAAASVLSLPTDVAPTKGHVASISGIQNFASNTAGIVQTYLIGVLLARTGSFILGLTLAGGFAVLGALSYLFIVPDVRPLGSPAPRS